MRAFVVIIEVMRTERHESFEGWYIARFDCCLQARQTPVGIAVNVAVDFAALLVKRAQTFVQPWRAIGKVRLDKWMNDLVNQRATASRDIHDQSFVTTRVIAVRRRRLLAKQSERVSFVRGRIFEQPDVENLFRVFGKIILFESIDGPFDGVLGMSFDDGFGFIADNYKWRLNNNRELRGRQLLL